jgi:hypothetical protein
MTELSAGDAKLIQYLNEAYGIEKRLETALEAHIAMTTQARYKKRLKEHLSETKRHGRDVKQRIKQVGGVAEAVPAPGPEPVADATRAVRRDEERMRTFLEREIPRLTKAVVKAEVPASQRRISTRAKTPRRRRATSKPAALSGT